MDDKILEILQNLSFGVDELQEADASINLNTDAVTFASFVLTDDIPNGNKQRVPKEEFQNLIKTGVYMPLKMAEGKIADGHEDSKPLGVITHLKEVGNQIKGLAALWKKERPEDVAKVKEMFDNGIQPQLSWEILYTNPNITEDGIEELRNTSLKAVTLVNLPAYKGRTPILAVSSQEGDETNSNLEENTLDIEELQKQIEELKTALSAKEAELATLKTQNEELASFKATVEKEKADKERLASIKQKFADSGISKEDSYFDENKEKLLGFSDDIVDFMIQEMVAFSAKNKTQSNSSDIRIPPITQNSDTIVDPKEMGRAFRELHKSKK